MEELLNTAGVSLEKAKHILIDAMYGNNDIHIDILLNAVLDYITKADNATCAAAEMEVKH